jgi:uncharacterized protein DUF4382
MRHPRLHRSTRLLILLGAAFTAATVFACSSGSASVDRTGTGTVRVHMIDAPLDLSTVQSVMVTIAGVTLYPGDETTMAPETPTTGPVTLLTHPETFDLLTLTGGASALLASGEAPAGRYERIRLDVSSAELTWKDGTTAPLKLDSGKVDIPLPFNLAVGADESITLDFDAGASVMVNETATDTLILRPVVTPVP